MIHLYCGDGKGKTTAALGLICRHVGTGGKAVLAQFLKSLPTGELKTLELLAVPVYRNELPHGFLSAIFSPASIFSTTASSQCVRLFKTA